MYVLIGVRIENLPFLPVSNMGDHLGFVFKQRAAEYK